MPQRVDLWRATSLGGLRRNRIATPTWADEVFGTGSVALRLPLSEGVVTWFVTDFRISHLEFLLPRTRERERSHRSIFHHSVI